MELASLIFLRGLLFYGVGQLHPDHWSLSHLSLRLASLPSRPSLHFFLRESLQNVQMGKPVVVLLPLHRAKKKMLSSRADVFQLCTHQCPHTPTATKKGNRRQNKRKCRISILICQLKLFLLHVADLPWCSWHHISSFETDQVKKNCRKGVYQLANDLFLAASRDSHKVVSA